MIRPAHTMSAMQADSSVVLLLRAQTGDTDALNRLLDRYLPRLRRWAHGRLPWRLRTMLETSDLVQDAIISALPHLSKLEMRTGHALEFYLQRAVRNRVVDLHRRSRRRPARDAMPEDAVAHGTSPEDDVIRAQASAQAVERYQRAFTALKDEERQAIVLRFELELDYEAIAGRLGKPTCDAARMTVTRAIARLADTMARRHRAQAC